MKKIVFASTNKGKVEEIKQLLLPYQIQIISQAELNIASVEETGLTFIENAILKARHASLNTGLPALADDSGLEVDILQGEPGIYSARYAGQGASDQANIEKLLQKLKLFNEVRYTARFRCVLALFRYPNDPAPMISEGVWEGEIITEPQGTAGFGYDPVFYVKEFEKTAAQLSSEEKNKVSHRAQAWNKLIQQLR